MRARLLPAAETWLTSLLSLIFLRWKIKARISIERIIVRMKSKSNRA
jgi:hypothetical protein